MRIVDPSLDSPWRGRPGDDLDRLLSDFFRSELPHPWPEAKIPDEQPKPLPAPARKSSPRWTTFRSRFALAASIALLLVGGWSLSGKFESASGPGGTTGSGPEATRGLVDQPGGRIRERIILDKNGQTKFRIELDLP